MGRWFFICIPPDRYQKRIKKMKLWRWRCGGLLDGEFLDAAAFLSERDVVRKVRAVVCRVLSTEHAPRHLIFSQSVKDLVRGPERLLCHAVKYFIFTWKILSRAIKDGWWFQESFWYNKRRGLWKIKCTNFCWNVTCDHCQTHLNDVTLVAEDTKFVQDAWFCCRWSWCWCWCWCVCRWWCCSIMLLLV